MSVSWLPKLENHVLYQNPLTDPLITVTHSKPKNPKQKPKPKMNLVCDMAKSEP